MDTPSLPEPAHPLGELAPASADEAPGAVFVDTFAGRVQVAWDPDAAVTPLGQAAFFIDFLKTAELWPPLVQECPLTYTSPNAPQVIDVLGTLFLSVLAGHWRYAHIEALRWDRVIPPLLGMTQVMSSSAARRAFRNTDEAACTAWLQHHLQRGYEPLLFVPWVLDIDTHIKPLYGHQEGARLGYNPKKPGRPSHVLHTYFMASTRLVLDVEVHAGDETGAEHTLPGLWALLERLPRPAWPAFLRGDCHFGNERVLGEAEARDVKYLFKLRRSPGVKALFYELLARPGWTDAGQGWQGMEASLKLMGWTRARRVVVLRRAVKEPGSVQEPDEEAPKQLTMVEVTPEGPRYEWAVLVTTLPDAVETLAQLYRDRGDAENNYDELGNQWGWGGFTTQDLKRCGVMARLTALACNWWNLFVGLAIPERHAEAVTSRPLLLYSVGRKTRHAGQTCLYVSSAHSHWERIQRALTGVAAFLASARQLAWPERWRLILSRVFVRFLEGRPLPAPPLLPAPP